MSSEEFIVTFRDPSVGHDIPTRDVQPWERQGVYELECSEGKYYVGWSSNLPQRLGHHMLGDASLWTKQYPPIRLAKYHPDATKADEKRITLERMKERGWENVRGGPWCKLTMSAPPLELMDREEYSVRCEKAAAAFGGITNCAGSEGEKNKPDKTTMPYALASMTIDKLRTKHTNAAKRWSVVDDETLVAKFKAGETIAQISKSLGRTEAAITARLQKHELIQKD